MVVSRSVNLHVLIKTSPEAFIQHMQIYISGDNHIVKISSFYQLMQIYTTGDNHLVKISSFYQYMHRERRAPIVALRLALRSSVAQNIELKATSDVRRGTSDERLRREVGGSGGSP